MSIKRLFCADLNETKRIIRDRIEGEVEGTLEDERKEAFSLNAIELCDSIACMATQQKEVMRIDTLKQLDEQRSRIITLWELFITRTALFQIWTDIFAKVGVIAAVVAFFLKAYGVALAIFAFALIFILMPLFGDLYSEISYITTGSGLIFDTLLEEYNRYGKLEARLFLADYRGLSHFKRDQKRWIYTTTHIIEAPS